MRDRKVLLKNVANNYRAKVIETLLATNNEMIFQTVFFSTLSVELWDDFGIIIGILYRPYPVIPA